MISNVVVGVSLFFAGVVLTLIWCYRDQIRTLLKLQESGAVDSAAQVVSGLQGLLGSFNK